MDPIRLFSKIEKWTGKVGSVSPGVGNILRGEMYYRAYQKGSGKNKHSGGAGRNGSRFYLERFFKKPKKSQTIQRVKKEK
jgi:hypothetical protein